MSGTPSKYSKRKQQSLPAKRRPGLLWVVLASIILYLCHFSFHWPFQSLHRQNDIPPKKDFILRKRRRGPLQVFNLPVELSLTTDGLVTNADELSGAYLLGTCADCRLYFPPYDESQNFTLQTLSGDKSMFQKLYVQPNQDQAILITTSKYQLLGLFDGHGETGHYASEAAVLELPFMVMKKLELLKDDPVEIASMLRESFLQVDRMTVSHLPDGGTTAILIYQSRETIHIASVGDSTAFCAAYRDGTATILLRAKQHKPGNPQERERIEDKGGVVTMPMRPGMSSRVIIPDARDAVFDVALAMSRSLGDERGKQLQYLSAEPSIETLSLTGIIDQQQLFCVVASDGLVDIVPRAKIANTVGKALFDQVGKLGAACHDLIEEAVNGWSRVTQGTYRDDISIVAAKVRR
jgi:serine/threonine protein phosphatase PrpC